MRVKAFFKNVVFTDRSCEHVVHQGAQTPPVHRSVVSASHQDLRGPATTRAHTFLTDELTLTSQQ